MTAAHGTRGTVAVTGVTGFVGSHVAPALHRRGWRVRALVRRLPRPLPVPPPDSAGAPVPHELELVPGELGDEQALGRLVAGADAIVHLAGAIRGRQAADFHHANVAGSERLVRAWLAHAPEARLVMVSTLAAREPGLSPYAASKRAAEEVLMRLAGSAPWLVLRPAAVYGPGDRETLRIIRALGGPVQLLLNDRDARVGLVHVDDLVAAVGAALEGGPVQEVFEITDPRADGYSWEEIARAVARALGRPWRPLRVPAPLLRALALAGDALTLAGLPAGLTSAKLREILHPDWSADPAHRPPPGFWQPRIDLEQGIAATIAWYRAAGWLSEPAPARPTPQERI